MIFSPNISVASPVSVSIIGNNPNASYQGLLNSLGTFVYYRMYKLQKQTSNPAQLSIPIQVTTTSANGNQVIFIKATPTSDFQKNQNSLLEDWSKDNVWIDNLTNFDFTVLPNTTISFFADTKTFYVPDLMSQ